MNCIMKTKKLVREDRLCMYLFSNKRRTPMNRPTDGRVVDRRAVLRNEKTFLC